jgi:hypothetical protein
MQRCLNSIQDVLGVLSSYRCAGELFAAGTACLVRDISQRPQRLCQHAIQLQHASGAAVQPTAAYSRCNVLWQIFLIAAAAITALAKSIHSSGCSSAMGSSEQLARFAAATANAVLM